MPLTTSQQVAVCARGNVIVVAGAGTGKTSTLVARCVALMEEGCSIENILMVTFTEAAAAEMRHRLRLRLAEVAAASGTDIRRGQWWQEQLALLDTARISTLHSVCLQLIRENFHLLGLDPTVRILDERQVRPLIEGALDACLAPHFAGTDSVSDSVRELICRYGQGEPERIRDLVLGLHRYAQSLDAPERWFASQLASLEEEEPILWRANLRDGVRAWAELWLPELQRAAALAPNLERCALALSRLLVAGAPESVAEVLREVMAADAADWPKNQKIRLREPFKKLFDEAEFLASQFEPVGAGDGLSEDWAIVRSSLRALLLLAMNFNARFRLSKQESAGMDFADLEQYALRLLWDAEGKLTPLARQWRATLAHVFVDECQDINAAQDAILRAISRHGEGDAGAGTAGNRFLVGDVKQSIYQFRLARPALFLGYEREWGQGKSGQRIVLSDNFRSAPGIIGFVNALFAPLMREAVGGVEYLPLQPGREARDCASLQADERAVEFHLIPKTIAEEAGDRDAGGSDGAAVVADDLQTVEREARLVALRLRELHRSGAEIWDREFKRLRRVEWRDMAVLLRSPANRVEAFAQEFHRCGVPLQAARGGFLQSAEITDLLSLLRILDNPLQDIPLLAVLRSPLVALTLDELAEIRIASRAARFWTALQEFHRKLSPVANPERVGQDQNLPSSAQSAWAKVDKFLQRLAVWREMVRQASLSHCLERALTDTDFEAIIESMERGVERAANVQRFVRMVREYDPYQRQGLFRFLRFVDALIEVGQDLEPAPAPSQNAVRLMSIHQSKGLEFPVVVVACLGSRFNLGDLHQDVLLDEEFGLCAKAVDPTSQVRHPTLVHWLAARRQRRQRLGEELRLLYVAATRARDRLVLTATGTRQDCEFWEAVEPRQFTSREMLSAGSPLDWLLLWLPTVTATGDWQHEGGVTRLLRWRIWREASAWELEQPEPGCVPAGGTDTTADGDESGVIQRIRWQYAHAKATHEPAKTNVTALRRKAAELMDEDAAQWPAASPPGWNRKRGTPAFNAAELGTLHHQFLQRMRLDGACDEADLRRQLTGMVEQGVFSAAASGSMNLCKIARFWQSDVGRQIRDHCACVQREVPFTARFSPVELGQITGGVGTSELADEFVVVQGVADLLVVGESELWLLDYKTDDLNVSELETRKTRYQPQLQLYASALARIYGKPVTHRWLHFLGPGETVVV